MVRWRNDSSSTNNNKTEGASTLNFASLELVQLLRVVVDNNDNNVDETCLGRQLSEPASSLHYNTNNYIKRHDDDELIVEKIRKVAAASLSSSGGDELKMTAGVHIRRSHDGTTTIAAITPEYARGIVRLMEELKLCPRMAIALYVEAMSSSSSSQSDDDVN